MTDDPKTLGEVMTGWSPDNPWCECGVLLSRHESEDADHEFKMAERMFKTPRKHDQGKARFALVPSGPLHEIAKVLTFGASKYGANNWRILPDARERYADALLRHVFAWTGGESLDPESGLHHLAHAGCCILFLLEFEANPWT